LRKYETIFVIDSLLKAEEIDNHVSKYERFISANGGTVEILERWGKKRLAYEIKKRQYGFYVFIRFNGPSSMIKSLEREYRLNESLLRYKTILMDKLALRALENQTYVKPAEVVADSKDLAAPVAKIEPEAILEDIQTEPEKSI
jgi:small subunit ribosomal protein S6